MAKVRTYLVVIFIGIGAAIILLLYLFWFINKNDVKNLSYNGIVVIKYEDYPCHGSIVISHGQRYDTIKNINYCGDSSRAIWKNAEVGDTITKNEGEEIILLNKKNKKMIFEYPRKAS